MAVIAPRLSIVVAPKPIQTTAMPFHRFRCQAKQQTYKKRKNTRLGQAYGLLFFISIRGSNPRAGTNYFKGLEGSKACPAALGVTLGATNRLLYGSGNAAGPFEASQMLSARVF